MNKQLSDLSDEDQRVLLSILVSRREEPICQCVTLEMSAPNSFNAGTIDIVASWPSLKTIATDQSNDPLSLLRRSLQLLVVLYVTLYQLWYAQGYQEFSTVESSTTTKVSSHQQKSRLWRNQNFYLGELVACYAVLWHQV